MPTTDIQEIEDMERGDQIQSLLNQGLSCQEIVEDLDLGHQEGAEELVALINHLFNRLEELQEARK